VLLPADQLQGRVRTAWAALVLTLLGFIFPWCGGGCDEQGLGSALEIMSDNNWTIVSTYGKFGPFLHIVLAATAPFFVRLPGRKRLFALAGALAGVWQLIAVQGAAMTGLSAAPFVGFNAALVLALAVAPPLGWSNE